MTRGRSSPWPRIEAPIHLFNTHMLWLHSTLNLSIEKYIAAMIANVETSNGDGSLTIYLT